MDLVSYAGWVMVIPVLFHLTSRLNLDRFIGELSYPVYLIHLTVIEIVNVIMERLSMPQTQLGAISAVLSILIAITLYRTIFKPFEDRRQNLVSNLLRKQKLPSPAVGVGLEK